MRILITILFFFIAFTASATKYHFSVADGNDSRTSTQAQSSSTPWQTLTKFNSYFASLSPGDSVLFKRGESFDGSMNISRSGSSGSPIFIGAYGTGANPVINGFTTLSGWTIVTGSIYETALNTGTRLNMLTIDGAISAPGRFPNYNTINGGYYTVTAHGPDGNTATWVKSTGLAGSLAGAEIVVRKNSYTFDRTNITSQNGDTLFYTSPSANGQDNGFGFFMQNYLSTLDSINEWYYNPVAHTIRIYGNPAGKVIKAATTETLVTLSNKSYINFRDLSFQGSDSSCIVFSGGANHINFDKCDLDYSFEAFFCDNFQTASYITIDSCSINHTGSSPAILYGTSNSTISYTTVKNSNLTPGIPRPKQDGYNGVYMKGSNNLFEYNIIDSCGGVPLSFNGGSNIIARNNYINYFCTIVCDYGGIYTNGNDGFTDRKIIGNVILNGKGGYLGTDNPFPHSANGIYLDESANDVEVRGNSVYKMASNGIYIHQSTNSYIVGNTIYDCQDNLISQTDDENLTTGAPVIRGNRVASNVMVAASASQGVVRHGSTANDIWLFGSYDSNYYARPFNPVGMFSMTYNGNVTKLYNLIGWQTKYGWDAHGANVWNFPEFKTASTIGSNLFTNGAFNSGTTGVATYSPLSLSTETKLDGPSLKVSGTADSTTTQRVELHLGNRSSSNTYRLRFSSIGSANQEVLSARFIPNGGYTFFGNTYGAPIGLTRAENEIFITPPSGATDLTLVFDLHNNTPHWLDNVDFQQVTTTTVNIEDSIRFEYNATGSTKAVALPAVYQDMKGVSYTGVINLAPYSSAILKRIAALPANRFTIIGNIYFK